MKRRFWLLAIPLVGLAATVSTGETMKTNSIGMNLVNVEPGSFRMGAENPTPPDLGGPEGFLQGDWDERPSHDVTLTKPFWMSATEITNAQYELFDPTHRYLRGKYGFAIEDDEAVVFVSWNDAQAFCQWLSNKEGIPYRLPTEAEWEYACRAGTTSLFHTGDSLPEPFHKNVGQSWYPCAKRSRGRDEVVPLTVARTPANAWGLFDLHGNVEEWCHDWYGPYLPEPQTDPVGRASGDFKVTRGGSHSTELYYLRAANRGGVVPEERSWLIGFRVVSADLPATKPLPPPPPALHQQDVRAKAPADLTDGPDPNKPYFSGPVEYVRLPEDNHGPLFARHNHVPNLVECGNGDLLAIWYSCLTEKGRELGIVASRLRYGAREWEPASVFWNQPDRNDHAPALWCDTDGTLYHFNGYSVAATWGSLAMVLRVSKDHGATWSKARVILPEHHTRQMPIESVFRSHDGAIVLPCDAVTTGEGGTALYVSRDNGETWVDAGGTIAGIHACVAQLEDGRLLAFGRGNNIDGRMPKSVSADMGRTWERSAALFPPVSSGQRPVMLRLAEGPLVFVSFTGDRSGKTTMPIRDASGQERDVSGMFAALSYDDGETWPRIRLVSHDGPDTTVATMDGRPFPLGFSSAEPGGYLSIWQAANGLVHLITSRQHYTFNFKWLETPAPAKPRGASE